MGPGYGDAEWAHGQWKGDKWAESVVVDLTDPAVVPRIPFGNIDHVARAECDGAEGFGLFEHASIGAHGPSGFADLMELTPQRRARPREPPRGLRWRTSHSP